MNSIAVPIGETAEEDEQCVDDPPRDRNNQAVNRQGKHQHEDAADVIAGVKMVKAEDSKNHANQQDDKNIAGRVPADELALGLRKMVPGMETRVVTLVGGVKNTRTGYAYGSAYAGSSDSDMGSAEAGRQRCPMF